MALAPVLCLSSGHMLPSPAHPGSNETEPGHAQGAAGIGQTGRRGL